MNDQLESNYALLVRSEEKGRGVLEALTDKLWGNANSRMEISAPPAQDVYEIRPRMDRAGFDLIGDRLRFGPIWYAGLDAVRYAVAYAKYCSRSRSHRAIIRVFNEEGNVTETHAGEIPSRKSNRVRRNCGGDLMTPH
jgi:hypothetical protein